jgi:galactokinase
MTIENDALSREFRKKYGAAPTLVARAPGRVNLIGEHTDYNGGFVLPAAINREIKIACSPTDDGAVTMCAVDLDETRTFPLGSVQRDAACRWIAYPQGVAVVLQGEGYKLRGMKAVVMGDVPLGAGLSSSAAFEVATAMALLAVSGFPETRFLKERGFLVRLARLCQRAENEFVGVNCGIMDQYVSIHAKPGRAVFIDCRSLEHRLVPLDTQTSRIVISDTNVKRELAGSAYNVRRRQCEEAVRILKKHAPGATCLRDISPELLKAHEDELPDVIRRRARHVVSEDDRVLRSLKALERGDLVLFGRLLNESHESLRGDYEVSCRELDMMVEAARALPGCLGSRLTGAGFGGCAVSLVMAGAVDGFCTGLAERYRAATGREARIIISDAADGAGVTTVKG